jgi:dihydroorotase
VTASHDLVITNARVVTPDGVLDGGIAVTGGRVAALFAPDQVPSAARTLDARGHYVLPGVIDSHVHFRTPA